MKDLQQRIEAAQAAMQTLPEWALQNMYWSGGTDHTYSTSATEMLTHPAVNFGTVHHDS